MSEHFTVLGLDHVNITTPEDLEEEVVAWYQSCLGLTRLKKPEGTRSNGAWFKAGPQEVHVSVGEQNPHQIAHFCLVVDEFDGVIERLREAGCHIEQAATIPGRRRFFTRDPAGNRLEVAYIEEPTAQVLSEERA